MRVIDAEAGPGALFLAVLAEGFGLAVPDPVLVDLCVELVLGRAVEEVPFQIVFAHMVFAEPKEVIEIVGRFRGAVLAGLLAARMFAYAGRGLERAGHAALRVRDRFFLSDETRRSKPNGSDFAILPAFPTRTREFSRLATDLKGGRVQKMSIEDEMRDKLQTAFQPRVLEIEDESEKHRGHAGYREGGQSHFQVCRSRPRCSADEPDRAAPGGAWRIGQGSGRAHSCAGVADQRLTSLWFAPGLRPIAMPAARIFSDKR